MNFILEPDKKSAFTGNIDVDTIILNLSALIQGSRFIEGKTCIILDEIQECKEARTALKSFHIDGRFDVIATGSLLGVKDYGKSKKKNEEEGQDSVPVGYETVIDMYPLDFEEFLWANGIGEAVIDSVKSCFENEKAVPDGIHKAMMELLYRYVIVGGLPEVVNCFLETKNIELIYKAQRNLIAEYEEDMVKYADDADKPNIRECFESIPKQLAKENKKFQYSIVKKGGRASQYIGSIQWLEDAGIVRRCYNTQITELPLEGNSIKECFKVYTTDIGILMAMLDYGIQADNTDYIEVSMGIRAEGAVASLSSFVSKCAMGIGGAIPGYLLQLAGFDSKAAVQNDDVINVIVLCVLILPAIVNVVAIVIFSKGYPITKEKLNEQICLMREKRSKAGISE